MKKTLFCLFIILSLCVFMNAQSTIHSTHKPDANQTKEGKPAFRANKDQILLAQSFLKVAETGKLTKADRDALKAYQKENGLRSTGSLNRATMEKMGIPLTDKQKEIPVDPNSLLKARPTGTQQKTAIFRANKDQVMQAQRIVKVMETGRLDNTTRTALKSYQSENGLKITGTLNKDTLEKMGIGLTEKQREM